MLFTGGQHAPINRLITGILGGYNPNHKSMVHVSGSMDVVVTCPGAPPAPPPVHRILLEPVALELGAAAGAAAGSSARGLGGSVGAGRLLVVVRLDDDPGRCGSCDGEVRVK